MASPGVGGSLSAASDVNLNSPVNGQVLKRDDGFWKNLADNGGGSLGGGQITVASVDAPANIKAAADYVCDGTADQDEINAAMASISNDVVGLGTQGGTVQLWGNKFTINGPIKMRTQCTLQGSGKFTTWINGTPSYSPGENGGLIELHSRDSQYTLVRELTVNGGGANACGFYYMMSEGQSWDAAHSVTDVYVRNPLWHGMYMTWDKSLSTSRNKSYFFQNVKILDAGTTVNSQAYGVYLDAADCIFISVDAGSSANHGFYITGSNNRFSQCAGWFSGSLASAPHEGSGFYVDGARNQFISCKSQDNYGDGFHLRSSDQALSACTADSNGYNRSTPGPSGESGWTGSGFYLQGYNLRVDGNAIEKNEQGRPIYQRYHVETGRSNVYAIVTVVTGGNSSVPKQGGPAFHASSVVNIVGG